MGVQVTLKDIQSGFLSAATHTANNTLIENAMDKTLDRTANVNNAMEVDLDLGLNRVINVEDGLLLKDGVNLGQVKAIVNTSGSGVATALGVSYDNTSSKLIAADVQNALDELKADVNTYNTVAEAVAATSHNVGDSVRIQNYTTTNNSGVLLGKVVPAGTSTADGFRYIDLPNSIPTTQLEISTSRHADVLAAGAEGDGVTDDSSSFLTASMATIESVLVPAGTYNVPSGDFSSNKFHSFGKVTILNNPTVKVKDLTLPDAFSARARSLLTVGSVKGASSWSALGPINNLGDSISHGAFAIDSYYHAWPNIMSRMLNADFGSEGYNGFVPLASLGTGLTATRDIHGVNFAGSWLFNNDDTVNGAKSYNGGTWFTTTQTDSIIVTVPTFQKRVIVWYMQQPNGGEITITQNGTGPVVINTDGVLSVKAQYLNVVDDGTGEFSIKVEKTDATANPIDVMGFGYVDKENTQQTMHNFSNSGRTLRSVPDDVIVDMCNNSSALMLSLGVNDYGTVDLDPLGTEGMLFTSRVDKIIEQCNLNNTFLVVNDFCMIAPDTSFTRKELKRAADMTGGIYIPFPNLVKPNGTVADSDYLINTLGMWSDSVHPNIEGHRWLAETMASYLGLSVKTKKNALAYHDFWMPFDLPAGPILNAFSDPDLVSAYRMQGSELLYRVNFTSTSAPAAIPIAYYNLQTAWRTFNGPIPFKPLSGTLRHAGDIRNDTGTVTAITALSSAGNLDFGVFSLWLATNGSTGNMPIEVIT